MPWSIRCAQRATCQTVEQPIASPCGAIVRGDTPHSIREVAARYAPDLTLVGVAAAAPATYLVELFDADAATAQDLVAISLLSWTSLENVPLTQVVEPAAMSAFEQTARDCIESVAEFEAIEKAESPLTREKYLKVNPAKAAP